MEQSLKDGWESNEPGRFDLARNSRAFHLVKRKKSMGEALTSNEEIVLKKPLRERKISMPVNMEELPKISNKDIKGKKGIPETNTKIKKDTIEKPLVINNEYQIDLNKPNLPTLNLHTALNIRKFLSYCYDERTIEKELLSELKPISNIYNIFRFINT